MENNDFISLARCAKKASVKAQGLSSKIKNAALEAVAKALEINKAKIFEANREDLQYAKTLLNNGELTPSTFNRLKLDENKMRDMVKGIIDISRLDDPVNRTLLARELDEGLTLYKVSCPIGVLGIIFEARPDVISQISALAIKSSNSVILKGGKEAKNTNKIILDIINKALDTVEGFPKNLLSQIYSREDVSKMLDADKYIDLIIPRGGNSLVKFIKSNTKIPVLGHADGVCHIYTDKNADIEIAKKVVIDAKTQYSSACNTVETLLIHKDFAQSEELLNAVKNAGVELISEPETWHREYSDLKLAYKYVENIDKAIEHINEYGSGHTESIITTDDKAAEKFMNLVDSAGVYHNVSTRFADGFRYGFGAEVGISTNKTHARGPVGIDGLVIYKYKLIGNGQIVKDYADGEKQFHHKDLK
ncbi:MAG: glutamate-5-semialdehyde dehydrogenase [Candidatus Gastranaerophilales bacterium]|nr:glutamate-5-semialdehyde dehydrogenase [Candidatus Gastranaerophilales bacterium]